MLEGFGVRLRPLAPFLQLLFGLLHELDRLRAVSVVVMHRLLELFLGTLEVPRRRDHVGMAAWPCARLDLWRWRRGRRRLRCDRGGEQNAGERGPADP